MPATCLTYARPSRKTGQIHIRWTMPNHMPETSGNRHFVLVVKPVQQFLADLEEQSRDFPVDRPIGAKPAFAVAREVSQPVSPLRGRVQHVLQHGKFPCAERAIHRDTVPLARNYI